MLTRRPLVVTALLSALLMVLSGCAVGTNPFGGSQITVTAYLTDSAGVFVGNDVGVLGVTVGRIAAITPEGTQVKVTMKVNADQPIPAGAGAVVVPRSVATDRYIELTPVYHSGPRMQNGAVIPVDRTRTPVEFDEVLSSLGNLARGLAGNGSTKGAISRLLAVGSKTLKGKGNLINQSIKSLGAATNGIASQRNNATSTLVALDQLTSKLASNQGTVRAFIDQVSRATSMLAAERENFRTSLRSVTKMVRVVAQFAQTNRAQITRAVNQTDDVMANVLSQRKQVAEVLRVMPLAAQNLSRMLGPDNRLRVRLDITQLVPVIGPVLGALCKIVPGDLCTAIGLDPAGLTDALGNLLNSLGLGGKK